MPVTMTGGDNGSRDAKLSCFAYLYEARKRDLLSEYDIRELLERMDAGERKQAYSVVEKALDSGIGTYRSSSMGRLFDAVAALLGLCLTNTYEGECAETLQAAAEEWAYLSVTPGDGFKGDTEHSLLPDCPPDEPSEVWAPIKAWKDLLVVDSVFLFAELARLYLYGEEPGRLAFLFHRAVADASSELCERINENRDDAGAGCSVALGGGTMCNRLLLQLLIPGLRQKGYEVYLNEKVPCGDGGIALGQLLAREAEEE